MDGSVMDMHCGSRLVAQVDGPLRTLSDRFVHIDPSYGARKWLSNRNRWSTRLWRCGMRCVECRTWLPRDAHFCCRCGTAQSIGGKESVPMAEVELFRYQPGAARRRFSRETCGPLVMTNERLILEPPFDHLFLREIECAVARSGRYGGLEKRHWVAIYCWDSQADHFGAMQIACASADEAAYIEASINTILRRDGGGTAQG